MQELAHCDTRPIKVQPRSHFLVSCERPERVRDLYALVGEASPWYLQRARLTSGMREKGLQALSTEDMRSLARSARRQGVRAALRQGVSSKEKNIP
jgi:hypothetical protein